MISRIQIQNFKSFKSLSLDLGKNNVLVGPNMTGKSNLLDAFRFLADLLLPVSGVQGVGNAFNKRNGFQQVVWKGGTSDLISFTVEGSLRETPDFRWTYHFELVGERRFGTVTVQREELGLATPEAPVALISTEGAKRILRSSGRGPIEINDPNRLALEYDIPDWVGNEVRSSLVASRFYRLIPPLMKQFNPSAAVQFLTEYGDNLGSWLLLLQTRYQEQFGKIVSACRDVFPDVQDLFTWPTQQSTVYVASREKFLKSPTTVWEMSEGELAFIAWLSLIFSPPEVGAPVYCIEEPENHLHPRLLSVLTELLKQVQTELGSKEAAQLLISTHSPYLIDKCSIDDLIVFRRHEGFTECIRPSNHDHFKKLVEAGELGLGELYYSGALSRA